MYAQNYIKKDMNVLILSIIFLHKSEPLFVSINILSIPCNTIIPPQDGVILQHFVLHSYTTMFLQFSVLLAKVSGNKGIQYHSQHTMWSSNTQNSVPQFKRFLKLDLKNQLRASVRYNHRRIKYDALIHNRFALYVSQQ